MSLEIVPFVRSHIREGFYCGIPELDRYLKQYASQDARRNLATLFVAVEDETTGILGYYTLSNASVSMSVIPERLQGKLSKYNEVPAIRLGRLAVDRSVQGQSLGTKLLANAVIRSVSNISAWAIMVVDAKNEAASAFYMKYGFESLKDDVKHLFAPRRGLELLFNVG